MMADAPGLIVLLAHPALHRSRINARLAMAARTVEGVEVIDLYERYPDFAIDVTAEQARLRTCRGLVFQHPFFWYSCPALLKEWIDLVLEHGFAYGTDGTALRGKPLWSVISTGGGADTYRSEGLNRFTVAEMLRPFEQTAQLCGMPWREPLLVHGSHRCTDAELEESARRYTDGLRSLLGGATP